MIFLNDRPQNRRSAKSCFDLDAILKVRQRKLLDRSILQVLQRSGWSNDLSNKWLEIDALLLNRMLAPSLAL